MIAALFAAILIVSSGGPYTSIQEALGAAEPGDTIRVRGGVHGPLVIDKPVTLLGEDGAVIDGEGRGDVIRVEAPDVTIAGFEIRNSGRVLEKEHAGITLLAPRATVRDNVMHDVLFGVFLKESNGSVVRDNQITGYDFELGRRGDGIRAWYSADASVINNHVHRTRDVILWFSDGAVIERNRVTDGRYGLHFMYDDGMVVRGNELSHNSVGMFLMYSRDVVVEDNHLHDNGGPSGYGLGLKEVDDLTVRGNAIVRNRIGISFDTTPHQNDAFAAVHGNLLAFNQVGLSFQPSTKRVEVIGNSLDRNGSQLEIRGGGDLSGNTWSAERGNYWSDYAGYDADGDGLGDLPYEPTSLFETMRDANPVLSLFNYGPAAMAVDFAARAFPNLRPSAKVTDERPLMVPESPAWLELPRERARPLLAAGGLLAAVTLLMGALMARAPRLRRLPGDARRERRSDGTAALCARGVTKRYGRRTVLDRLDLEVRDGEAVALWGGNGAGKTTALRCLLGVVRHDGDVSVAGIDRRRDEREARAHLGYVPQTQDLPDLPAGELFALFGRLRSADERAVREAAVLVGIEDHLDRRPAELSGGLRQRLALALALLGRPQVLLLDEPTANLDVAARESMLRLIAGMRDRGTAVLFTTHREDEVIALADRVVTLADGRVVEEQDAERFARSLERRDAVLLVRVADADLEAARAALRDAGIEHAASAGWLRIPTSTPDRPLRALWERGIAVQESHTGGGR